MSKPSLTDLSSASFSQRIVRWYHQHGRKHLPWQTEGGTEPNPYHIWLSEIMLQQTQVVKVIEYFDRFIKALPTLNDLAAANEQQVLALWSGLGYYNRARNLHKAAQQCVTNHQGELPQALEQLMALPGIGRSTAAAIMSLAYGEPEPIMDGNVKRVFSRHFLVSGEPNQASTLKQLWSLAEKHKEHQEPAAYTQGLMDLGATLCTRSQPNCTVCPVVNSCEAHRLGVVADYPQKKNKVVQKEVDWYVALFLDEHKIGLSQRQSDQIWPNLWFLPTFADEQGLLAAVPDGQHRFSLTHKLTHRILQIHVYVAAKSSTTNKGPSVDWFSRDELHDTPHPKALNHILKQHDNH